MMTDPSKKYPPFPTVSLPDRQLPARALTPPPVWCRGELRHGNPATPVPMGGGPKLGVFHTLVARAAVHPLDEYRNAKDQAGRLARRRAAHADEVV